MRHASALRAQAHYRAAKAAIALGDYERAAAACSSGLALEPESADFRSLQSAAAKQAAAKQARATGLALMQFDSALLSTWQ